MQAISERMQMILNPDSAAVGHPGAHHVTMQALCNAGMINQHFSDVEDAEAWPPMEWSPDTIANVKSFDDAIQNALLPKQREVLRHTHGDEVLSIKLRFTRMFLTGDGSIILLAVEETQ